MKITKSVGGGGLLLKRNSLSLRLLIDVFLDVTERICCNAVEERKNENFWQGC